RHRRLHGDELEESAVHFLGVGPGDVVRTALDRNERAIADHDDLDADTLDALERLPAGGILYQPVDVAHGHRGNLGDVEAAECLSEGVSLCEHDRPAEPAPWNTPRVSASNMADSS